MVSIRLSSFVLIVFTLALIGVSSAADHSKVTILKRKLGADYDAAVPAAAEVEKSRLQGIRNILLMLKWGHSSSDKKMRVLTVEGLKGSEDESAKISGADINYHHQSAVGKSSRHRGKGILNVNSKLRDRNPHHHRHNGKAKMAGFTAFSADYHVPKPHPPKNN